MIVPVECFTAICDYCGTSVCEGTDWSGWDMDGLEIAVEASNWLAAGDGRHLCDRCVTRLLDLCVELATLPAAGGSE